MVNPKSSAGRHGTTTPEAATPAAVAKRGESCRCRIAADLTALACFAALGHFTVPCREIRS